MTTDIDSYAARAEAFTSELDREYHLHFSGQKPGFEVEEIYARHQGLFEREPVERLREQVESSKGELRRRGRYLLELAVSGHIGRACAGEEARLAELEASLSFEIGGEEVPFRMAPVRQANATDPDERAEIEQCRHELLAEHLNPLHEAALRRSHELVRDLGWGSYLEAYADLRGIDLVELGTQTQAFLDATEAVYTDLVGAEFEREVGLSFAHAQRSDLARFFRAPGLDGSFDSERLISSFEETMSGLGLDVRAQKNIILDTEPRPTKTPRAYCAPVRVPDEVYLVVPRVGGREDFAALFHEAGHAEHYANVDADLPFEFRHLGDNSVTESFAFLFEHIAEDPAWLGGVMGAEPERIVTHVRAVRLYFLRRYAAKIIYELELHGPGADLKLMPDRYAELLEDATKVAWTPHTWIEDVDGGFYVAAYLRAWALESRWRAHLEGRFGGDWISEPAAGEWLTGLWRNGQRLQGHELLTETLGEDLRFDALAANYA